MYVYYDDRSIIFETEEEAKQFLLEELTQWDNDFFTETLSEHLSAAEIFDMLVSGKPTEQIRYDCDDVVYDAAVREIEDNFGQYFDEIDEDEED